MSEYGPFNQERDALQTRAVRAVYAAFDADPGVGKMQPHNLAMLEEACDSIGVERGEWDTRILAGLADHEPAACAVIAGLIRRAAKPEPGTVTEWGLRFTGGSGEPFFERYPSEEAARYARPGFLGVFDTVVVVHHDIGPWTVAPETAKDGSDA